MIKRLYLSILVTVSVAAISHAAPVGAVLYLDKSPVHHSRIKVPATAPHHYFGFLEGPALENKYSAYRVYVDKDNRNAIDFIAKYKLEPILHHFDDPSVDEHVNHPWGTDCFSVSTTMGLGHFRLYYADKWLDPQLGINIDSLVITVLDSSTQTPSVSMVFFGWNIGEGKKVTVTWILSAIYEERPLRCEVSIEGNYTGQVVVGMVNNNKRGYPVGLIQDADRGLLATLGKQGSVGEKFADTLLLALSTEKKYFSKFAEDAQHYGMVLSLDAEKKVKWSVVANWAKEPSPIFRTSDWQDKLFDQNVAVNSQKFKSLSMQHGIKTAQSHEVFTLAGKKIGVQSKQSSVLREPKGVYLVKYSNGVLQKKCTIGTK